MREDVTIQLRLSLAKHSNINFWIVKIEIGLKTCPLKYDVYTVVKFNFEYPLNKHDI